MKLLFVGQPSDEPITFVLAVKKTTLVGAGKVSAFICVDFNISEFIDYQHRYINIEPAKATDSVISPLSVRPFVVRFDLRNRSNDFSETWHGVGGQ